MVADSVNISGQSNIIQFKVPECKLSEDLGNLFDNEKFSDVTLSVGGREFQAHKAILAGELIELRLSEIVDFILLVQQREVLSSRQCSSMKWKSANKIVSPSPMLTMKC